MSRPDKPQYSVLFILLQYMAKSKSYLDRQLDDYMNQKKAEAAAVTAGTVVVGDADVTMSET